MKNLKQCDDFRLINGHLNGDRACLGILYERYFEKVYSRCLCYFHQDKDLAFDAAQDSLITAFTKIETFRGDSSFSTWLFTVTNNVCLQKLRKNKKRPFLRINNLFDIAADEDNAAPDAQLELEQSSAGKLKAFYESDEEDRNLLVDKYIKNVSIRQLQRTLGASQSAVKMRLLRAKRKVLSLYYAQGAQLNLL